MPLPAPTVARKPKHVRRMVFEAFEREDGLWDLEGHLRDHKPVDVQMLHGIRPAGEPVHDMYLRLTIDRAFNVLEAAGYMDAAPYPGTCETVAPDYGRLVGLNLMHRFRAESSTRLGRTERCTHLSELVNHMPTLAVQSMFREIIKTDTSKKPLQIDQCHAQRSDSEVVRMVFPKWYTGPNAVADQTESE
jgi:hypothetical protein